MAINQLKSGVIISYATQAVHILSGIIYTPVMLRLLGQSEYGLYQLVGSVISYLSLLTFGFGASYVRFYSRYKVNNDETGIAKLNGMFFVIFSVITLICLICGAFLTFNVKNIFGNGLTIAELEKSKILMAMMAFNMAVVLLGNVFTNIITANERFFFPRVLTLLTALLDPILTLPVLFFGFGSVGLVCIKTLLTVAVFIMNVVFCLRKLETKFSFQSFDFSLLKEMSVFTAIIFINLIVDQINWSVDKFLLGRIIGTTAVALYGVAGNLNTMYMSFSTAVMSVFVPKVNMLVAKEKDNKDLTYLFTRVGRIQFIIIGLILSGYVLFGREFIAVWAGNGYEESYIIGLFLMIPITIPLIQNLGVEIQRAKNKHQVRSVVYLFVALSNIFLSIFCIKKWGASGAAVGTMISLLLGNGLFMNVYYHKKIGLDIIYFWKQIARVMPALSITVVLGIAIKAFIGCNSIIQLGVNIVLYSVIYIVSFWFMGMNKEEKALIEGPLNSIGAKICKR